jgi:MFS family permease
MSALTRQIKRISGMNRNTRLFLWMIAIYGLGNSVFQLLFNLFILARGDDLAFLGLLKSSTSMAALVLGFPLGVLTDRIGIRRSMFIGVLCASVGLGALVMAPVQGLLLLAAAVMGVGNALFRAAGPAFVAQNTCEDDRPTAFSLQSSLRMLVAFGGSIVGGAMPGWFAIWLGTAQEGVLAYRAALLLAASVMILSLIPMLVARQSDRATPEISTSVALSLRSLLWRRDVRRLVATQLIISLGAGLLIPYLNIFLKGRFGISDHLLGWIFAIYQLLIGVGTLAAPMLAERWGEVQTIVGTQLASLPFLMALGFAPFLPVAIGALWLRAMLMNMSNPLYTAFAMRQARDRERGKVGALLGATSSVGWMIGPGVSGLVQQNLGFAPLFLTTGATYLLASLLMRLFFKKPVD